MAETVVHFDNPKEYNDIVGRGTDVLRQMERALRIRLTARDTWVRIEGEPDDAARAARYFDSLRRARGRGVPLREHGLLYTLDAFREGREDALEQMHAFRIEVGAGKPSVFPRTFGQFDYLKAIAARDIAFGIGPAGTGKTYLAMAMAVATLLRGDVSRIILTRPAVEAGEALGFLPGSLHEKVLPYLRPLHDALYDMMAPEEIERHMERGVIEVAPLAYMRGRTLNHAFVILDEAQNTTPEQMLMFLTRLGFDSKCVITGDVTQIDLPPAKSSGLVEASRVLREITDIAIIELGDEDVVRHELVQRIIQAYRRLRSDPRA
jgi:phosphate starvation-inducible PhoH-like protein